MPGGELLRELVVQGVRQGLKHTLASALSGAASSTIGNLASRGLLSGLTFSSPDLASAVQRAQANLPAQPTPPPAKPPTAAPEPPEVAPVVVTPSMPTTAPGGALGQAISTGAGKTALIGGAGADPIQAPGQDPENEVATVDVTGTRKPPLANIGVPATLGVGALGAALAASGGGAAAAAPTAEPNEVQTLDVVGQRVPPPLNPEIVPPAAGTLGALTTMDPQNLEPSAPDAVETKDGLGPEDLLAPAALGVGMLTPSMNPDNLEPSSDGFDLPVRDLVAAGVLGAGLLGGTGGGGDAKDALKGLADQSAALAGRLGNIAAAGFGGDIGGRGLNSIARMVRKAQAAIRQRYSAMGMSGSTAEGQDLQAAADAGVDLQFKVGQEMAVAGLNAIAALTGQSASIYTAMLNAQTAKNTALGNALANFAAALVR